MPIDTDILFFYILNYPDMEVEDRVMKALNEVKSFGKLAGGGIGLYDADNTLVMVLVKK